MQAKPELPITELVAALAIEARDFDRRRQAQAAVWKGEQVEYLPLLIGGGAVPEAVGVPRYNLEQQWYSPALMLREGLYAMLSVARSGSEAVPSIRPNLGVGTLATVFGVRQSVFPDKMPWVTRHLTFDEIEAFEPEDIEAKGILPRALDYLAWFREQLGDAGNVYLADTQAPFDIAHLVAGDRIFTDMFDQPAHVHKLMRDCTAVYIEATKLMKQAAGEDATAHHHSNTLYSPVCGARACEDTSLLLSPPLFAEFSLPYLAEAIKPFGAWVHWCGDAKHVMRDWISMDKSFCINFGNPESYDWAEIMQLCRQANTLVFGGPPREPGETLQNYHRRVLAYLAGEQRLLLFYPCGWSAGESCTEQLDCWHAAQDEVFH